MFAFKCGRPIAILPLVYSCGDTKLNFLRSWFSATVFGKREAVEDHLPISRLFLFASHSVQIYYMVAVLKHCPLYLYYHMLFLSHHYRHSDSEWGVGAVKACSLFNLYVGSMLHLRNRNPEPMIWVLLIYLWERRLTTYFEGFCATLFINLY